MTSTTLDQQADMDERFQTEAAHCVHCHTLVWYDHAGTGLYLDVRALRYLDAASDCPDGREHQG